MRDDELTAEDRYRAAGAEYAAASADYEAAAMSGDSVQLAAADHRLAEADRLYCETLAEVSAASGDDNSQSLPVPASSGAGRRAAIPSFEHVLRQPWSQPDPRATVLAKVIYAAAVPQTAGLPVTHSAAPAASIVADAREAAFKTLFHDTGSRELVPC